MKTFGLAVLLVALSAAASVRAVVIYDTFGPDPYLRSGPTYTPGWGFTWFTQVGAGQELAVLFSFSGSVYRLDSITLDIAGDSTPNLGIRIYGDNTGTPSLTPVAQLAPNPTLLSDTRQILTYQFSDAVYLEPNTPYWLGLGPSIVATNGTVGNTIFNISSTPAASPWTTAARNFSESDLDGTDWTVFANTRQPVFRLDGTAVPEPSTWALLGLGSALGWCATRRRRN